MAAKTVAGCRITLFESHARNSRCFHSHSRDAIFLPPFFCHPCDLVFIRIRREDFGQEDKNAAATGLVRLRWIIGVNFLPRRVPACEKNSFPGKLEAYCTRVLPPSTRIGQLTAINLTAGAIMISNVTVLSYQLLPSLRRQFLRHPAATHSQPSTDLA